MCCNRTCSICFLVIINIVVLVVNCCILGVLIWADAKWDFATYMEMVGLSNADIVYYIVFGVIGGIAVIALLGLIACCCSKKILMTVYAILCIIFLIILVAVTLAWLSVFIYVLLNLHDMMVDHFEKYKGETGTNYESIIYNAMFVALQTCGVDGPNDFNKYNVPASTISGFESYTHPLTCCAGLIDEVSDLPDKIQDEEMSVSGWDNLKNEELQFFDNCENKPNKEGAYPVLKNYITILFVVVLLFLALLVVFLTLLVWAACSILKKGPKKDKWAKKYTAEEVKTSGGRTTGAKGSGGKKK